MFRGHDFQLKKQNGLLLIKEFEKRLGRKGRLLDVGCGIGELLWAAKESGWDYVGIDPSKQFIEIAREKLGVEGKTTTLEDAGFSDNSFDIVTMGGIIEHLYSPLTTLDEVNRILRPDGWFWFDAPNEDGLYMKAGNLYMRLRGKDWVVTLAPTFPPYHVQGFNPNSLRKLMAKTKFEIVELQILGDIKSQTGKQTVRKNIEFRAAQIVNQIGKALGKGMYMSVWARKKETIT